MIGVVTTSYPRSAGDYAGVFVAARVAALARAGETVEVIAAGEAPGATRATDVTGATGATTGARGARDLETGLSGELVRRVPFTIAGGVGLFYSAGGPEALAAARGRAWLEGLRFWGGLCDALRARARDWQGVESHWLLPSAVAVVEVWRQGAHRFGDRAAGAWGRHRAHAHGGDVALLERLPGGGALGRRLVASGAELVFASADLLERFSRLVGAAAARSLEGRALVSPAPIAEPPAPRPSPEERARARAALGLSRPAVLGVGRLVPVKGFDVLVRAVGRLPPESRPSVLLAGDGPERWALAALAASRGVDLRLLGVVDRRDLARVRAATDLVVQPSRRLPTGRTEGTPLAVQEALACGCRVVASALGGIPDLVDPSRHKLTLVAADDPAALARALQIQLATV